MTDDLSCLSVIGGKKWEMGCMRLPMKEEDLVLKGKTDLCHEDSRNYKK